MCYEEMSVAVLNSLYGFCLFWAVSFAVFGLCGFFLRARILPLLVICIPGFCGLLGLLVVQNIDYGYLQDERKPRWAEFMAQADCKRSFPAVESVTSWREKGWKTRIELSVPAPVSTAERMEMSRSLVAAYLKIQPAPWEEVRLVWKTPGADGTEEVLVFPGWTRSFSGPGRNADRYPGGSAAAVAAIVLGLEALLIVRLSRKFLFAAAKNRQERGLIGGTVIWLLYGVGMLGLMGWGGAGFFIGMNGFLWGGVIGGYAAALMGLVQLRRQEISPPCMEYLSLCCGGAFYSLLTVVGMLTLTS